MIEVLKWVFIAAGGLLAGGLALAYELRRVRASRRRREHMEAFEVWADGHRRGEDWGPR